jgi:hypothetical protein
MGIEYHIGGMDANEYNLLSVTLLLLSDCIDDRSRWSIQRMALMGRGCLVGSIATVACSHLLRLFLTCLACLVLFAAEVGISGYLDSVSRE